jgi:hypothetical protein
MARNVGMARSAGTITGASKPKAGGSTNPNLAS